MVHKEFLGLFQSNHLSVSGAACRGLKRVETETETAVCLQNHNKAMVTNPVAIWRKWKNQEHCVGDRVVMPRMYMYRKFAVYIFSNLWCVCRLFQFWIITLKPAVGPLFTAIISDTYTYIYICTYTYMFTHSYTYKHINIHVNHYIYIYI